MTGAKEGDTFGGSIRVAAVDLGATSGRVMAGRVVTGDSGSRVEIEEAHRFPNAAVQVGGSLRWDAMGIYREVLSGLRQVACTGPLQGLGIDSWAIDYGLIGREGDLLGNPFSHRDIRTDGVADQLASRVADAELYQTTGLQRLPFSTLYQLIAASGSEELRAAQTLLLLPDLLGYWLTGAVGAERTNASTTALYDARAGTWAESLLERVGLNSDILPPLREPGDVIGRLRVDAASAIGVDTDVPVLAVGSHDTASAVVAVPAASERFGFISSGTWSLVGLELASPVLTEAAREADFTNEAGVDGTVRFLKNVTGLWVLSESVRVWSQQDLHDIDPPSLVRSAAALEPVRTVIDINDPRLLGPSTDSDPMPDRIAALAHEAGEPVPITPAQIARCIFDSLAVAYRRHLRAAVELSGRRIDVVHVVGGGSQNTLLCQLTADACGLPVLAGPTEAAAYGNVLVQARALGAELDNLSAMRDAVRRSTDVRLYRPATGVDWESAQARVPVVR